MTLTESGPNGSSLTGSTALRRCWHPVAESADVDPGPLGVILLGEPLVLYRTHDGIVAAPDRCPHRQAPLSAGSMADDKLVCAYHGWGFGPCGACVSVPSSGADARIPPAAHLSCVSVEERYGLVWVALDEPAAPIPEIAQESDPAFRRINTGVELWHTCATRMVDNFLDIAHFPWVHVGTFGRGQTTEVPSIEIVELDDCFTGYAYEVDAANPAEAEATSGSKADVVHRHMSTGYALPLLVRSTIRYADGLEHILLLCSTPTDDDTSLFTFVVWRNDDHSVPAEEVVSFDRAIGAEDKAMLEQLSGPLPLERTELVSVQSDKASLHWRRRFAELLQA